MMMKRIVQVLLIAAFCAPAWAVDWTNYWVGIGDIDDAEISEGEYGYYARWVSYDPPLVVNGGGLKQLK